MKAPRIGVTLGDPGGIGPEVVVKALSNPTLLPEAKYLIFGSAAVLDWEEHALGVRLDRESIPIEETAESPRLAAKGAPEAGNGRASFRFFETAVEAARAGAIQAVVTAPISKSSWDLAGIRWRGQTEYLEHLYPGAIMTFWSERMTVALFSHHVPLREAVGRVTKENLARFFRTVGEAMERTRRGKGEFLVAGLNPHAGEGGLLGGEEKDEIIPAIEEARAAGMRIDGPYPPDIVFRAAAGHPEKIVVALYHDQGLIAFKLQAFESGVNVTLGLPFVRTSPDHGTAFDIVGEKRADPRSMIEAIRLAYELIPEKPSPGGRV